MLFLLLEARREEERRADKFQTAPKRRFRRIDRNSSSLPEVERNTRLPLVSQRNIFRRLLKQQGDRPGESPLEAGRANCAKLYPSLL